MKIKIFKTIKTNIQLWLMGIRMYQWSCLKHSIHLHYKDLKDKWIYWEEKDQCKVSYC